MKKKELEKKLVVSFLEKIDETFIILVKIEKKIFYVDCQFKDTQSYKQTNYLSCYNCSSGDFDGSGLAKYLKNEGFEFETDGYNFVVDKIEKCANAQLPENNVERVINEQNSEIFVLEKDLFGAFGPHDIMHSKYVSDDKKVIVTSEDTGELRAENQLLGYKKFNTLDEYKVWIDNIYQHGEYHYGDCSTSYRAWQDIVGEDE